jgi:heterodisulfide reductase subunit C
MEHSPRQLVGMIAAGLRQKVLASNAYWLCASCYLCSTRCPRGIDIAELMYGLKRYSMWRRSYKRNLVGPGFSKGFVRMILRRGRSYELGLAPSFVFAYGLRNLFRDARLFVTLLLRGRLSLVPSRTRRVRELRRVVGRIIPIGVVS